jgi:hypothetical protein
MSNSEVQPPREDPLMKSARREALVTAALTVAALAYTIGYAALFGYGRSAESLSFVLGIPDWVFWGIVAPWVVCLALSWWFSYWFIEDDPLEKAEPAPTDGSSAMEDATATLDSRAERLARGPGEGS